MRTPSAAQSDRLNAAVLALSGFILLVSAALAARLAAEHMERLAVLCGSSAAHCASSWPICSWIRSSLLSGVSQFGFD